MTSKKLLIIDTDCGVDDAVAILLALSSSDCQILAFTSVFGNTSAINAANNVLRLTNATNKTHIPVYVGCRKSLIGSKVEVDTTFQTGHDGFGGVSSQYPIGDQNVREETAVAALCRLVGENPGQVTLLALGPLTNLVVADLLDPNFATNLKELCVMGGNSEGVGNITASAEFNFNCDPEAAQHVLTEFNCPMVIVPWELTCRQSVDWDWFANWIKPNTRTAKIIGDVTKVSATMEWRPSYPTGIPLPDLLAVALTLQPDLIQEDIRAWTEVELSGARTRGMMVVDRRTELSKPDAKKNFSIAHRVDLEALKALLLPLTHEEWIT